MPFNINAFMNGYQPEPTDKQSARIVPKEIELIPQDQDRPAYQAPRPPAPPAQSKPSGCRHRYEVLEYPEPGRPNYYFYCVYCLETREKKPPGKG